MSALPSPSKSYLMFPAGGGGGGADNAAGSSAESRIVGDDSRGRGSEFALFSDGPVSEALGFVPAVINEGANAATNARAVAAVIVRLSLNVVCEGALLITKGSGGTETGGAGTGAAGAVAAFARVFPKGVIINEGNKRPVVTTSTEIPRKILFRFDGWIDE